MVYCLRTKEIESNETALSFASKEAPQVVPSAAVTRGLNMNERHVMRFAPRRHSQDVSYVLSITTLVNPNYVRSYIWWF